MEGSAFEVVGFIAPYNDTLSSMPPFMWIESHDRVGDLGVLAFGAYNAMGLIGPEGGGVAIVFEVGQRDVIAVKTIPYKPGERNEAARAVIEFIYDNIGDHTPIPRAKLDQLLEVLAESGFGMRQ